MNSQQMNRIIKHRVNAANIDREETMSEREAEAMKRMMIYRALAILVIAATVLIVALAKARIDQRRAEAEADAAHAVRVTMQGGRTAQSPSLF